MASALRRTLVLKHIVEHTHKQKEASDFYTRVQPFQGELNRPFYGGLHPPLVYAAFQA